MHEGKYRWMAKVKALITLEQPIKNFFLWYLDSGHSQHMMGDFIIFSTFSSLHDGSVTIGNRKDNLA